MATQVEPKTETEPQSEAQTVLADTTIVTDKTFSKLMTQVDTHQQKVGGKWAEVIEHCINTYHFRGVDETQKDDKEAVAKNRAEVALGKQVILKTLLEMGKVESSAYSIRSYIIKMSKAEHAEDLAKLKAGEITVRASRELGRKPQSNPSLSNEEKYNRALNDAVRFAVSLGLTRGKFGDDAERAFSQYYANAGKEEPTTLKS